MEENKIPTAEEFLADIRYVIYSEEEKLITFAKLHVKAALKAALEDAPYGSSTDTISYEDMKDTILEAYPEELIK